MGEVDQVIKRDGAMVSFDRRRIEKAIYAAAREVGNGEGRQWAEMLSWAVVGILEERFGQNGHTPHVEEIQDVVEEVLIKSGSPQIAKSYILYRQRRAEARAAQDMLLDTEKLVDSYLQCTDWRVNENSNMNYSLQGLNFYVASSIAARYWLHKIYPPEVQQAHVEGDLHLHDLGMLSTYTYFGQEVVIIKSERGIELISFAKLYELCEQPEIALSVEEEVYAKFPSGLQVLDKDGWTRISRLIRKKRHRPMRFVKNRGGRSVIVTDNHPMITRGGEKDASKVEESSDYLMTVDLRRLLKGEGLFGRQYIDLAHELSKRELLNTQGRGRLRLNSFVVDSVVPEIETDNGDMVSIGSHAMPRCVKLTEELGKCIGWILADGFVSQDVKTHSSITVVQKDVTHLVEIADILRGISVPSCIDRRDDRYELLIPNRAFRLLLTEVFQIGYGARNKVLPIQILQFDGQFVKGLLAGLIDGDGNAHETQIQLRLTSRTMLEQCATVLYLLGVWPRDRAIDGLGTERMGPKGQIIKQRYPIYGVSFRKTGILELDSFKYEEARTSDRKWMDETPDEWHKVLNNKSTNVPDEFIYDITTDTHTLVVNGMWNHNCCGWDLQDLLMQGFGGVPAKIESKPPRHLRTALGQLVNFFYTLQGESAGAVAVSNFDTLMAPFIRYDGLDYEAVKQAMQEFAFNINVPTRVGFQSLVWDELVVVKRNGRVEVTEIGRLADEQFGRNAHRVLSQGNDSFAVANADDVQALAFNDNGHVVWTPVKAFVRHRAPRGAAFVRVRTSRGAASVSQAHSLFAFEKLDGRFAPRPMAARDVDVVHGNAALTLTNHFVAVRQAPNGGTRDALDLVELIDAVPQVAARTRVRIPDPAQAVDRLRQRVRESFGGFTPFYLEYGVKDKGCWKRWTQGGTLPYRVWRLLGEDEPEAEFALRNSVLWYARTLDGERLGEFVRLLAWYITEGHNDITNGLYVSQARSGDQREITRVMNTLGALGYVEEMQGWSAQGNPTRTVLRMAGKGLLASLIGYLGGTYSANKVIPWFIYDLIPDLQEAFIATLVLGDGSEDADHYDYHTTSKKLSLGLSLLLAMNGYKFSVYEIAYEAQENWNDQYILRIYKNKDAAERYAAGDLLARVCTRRETFAYDREYEYDLSVDTELENFAGGSGLLCFHNTPFTNVTMDLTPPSTLRDQPVIVGGEVRREIYGDFQPEMDLFNRAFAEVMLEGDARGRVFTFPIPTYNITREFDWENPVLEPVWAMTARYGIPYWANFLSSDMDPEDARSMCCRLRLDNRELRKRIGGLFAAAPLTGSVGVATINMSRLGYLAHDEAEFQERLERLMEVARASLEIKRNLLEHLTEQGLYPYSRHYLQGIAHRFGSYWSNHFSTIGLIGMNEACLNLLGVGIVHPEGRGFAVRTLKFMRGVLARFQAETNHLYNLEATPAEGASFRLARADKERFLHILTAGTDHAPYYTNSSHLPVSYSDDLFEVLEHQDELQTLYTGGTVQHIFLGEQLDDWRQARRLVRVVAENFHLPYYTLTPTFSVCPVHGYISGEHKYCPYEHTEEELERFGRVAKG